MCVDLCVCVLVKHQHVRRCVRQNETLIFSFIHSATRRSLNKLTAAGEAVVLHVAPIVFEREKKVGRKGGKNCGPVCRTFWRVKPLVSPASQKFLRKSF